MKEYNFRLWQYGERKIYSQFFKDGSVRYLASVPVDE